jgi:phosphatidylinositol alpha-mannosyltransferase
MLGLPPAAFTLVPNGVDVARFVTHGAATRATPRIVFLGRLEHRKGADVVVRAFLALASERPDVELRILGDGPLRPLLERLRGGAPRAVAERIELAGRADPTALPRLLGDADVAVLPARGGESFGIVLLEAMAAGVPIVATDIPGYRDVARHDREALLVVPDDAAATAVAIGRILDEPALAARLRAAGRRRAEEHDWAAIAARMQALYGQAVAAPAEGGGPDGPDKRAR